MSDISLVWKQRVATIVRLPPLIPSVAAAIDAAVAYQKRVDQ